ncbi:MAG: TonB-dependent receptor [Proteobacteria bacterium]|nr:TonB-dependent receptor [Pseudomonadota bacterium]
MSRVGLNTASMRARRFWLATTALCAAMVPASAVRAADAPGTIETVVVTAEKRAEDLKDVPASISVLSDRYLSQIGADSLETLANSVPGVQMQSFGPGQTRITIRGISPDEQTGVTAVSYYLDEIPITASAQRSQPEVWLYDVDQVEVLRGPQGTLYGEGAMGGAVRIITNKPNTEEFQASARAQVYSVENGGIGYKVDGMANIPIVSDMLALRVVVENRFNAGWIDNTIIGIPDPSLSPPSRYVVSTVDKDANSAHNTSVRAALRFTPTENFTIDAQFIENDISSRTSSIGTVDAYHNTDLGLRPTTDVSELANLTATYNFDAFTVTSSSSYTVRRTNASLYQEPILLGSTAISTFQELTPETVKTFTQEVRAVSASDQPLRWTIGAYYRNGFDNSTVSATGYVPALTTTVPLFGFSTAANYNTYAVFGQAEYDILPDLTAIVGARWFHESQTVAPQHRSTDGWTPLVTLRKRFNDNLIGYATFSEGYRPGGFNAYAGPTTYAPDKTKNYEVGAKYVSSDNRLSLSGDIFYIDWSNMQFTQIDSGGFFTFVGNANKASSRGFEVEGTFHWDNGFWGGVNASFTSAHIDTPVVANLGGKTSAGTALPAVPPYKMSLSGGYNTTLWDGEYGLELSGIISVVGPQHTKLEQGGTFTLPGYGTYVIGTQLQAYGSANLRATITRDNYAASLFVNNVWNSLSPIADDNFFPTFGQPLYYVQPRTIGFEVSAKW